MSRLQAGPLAGADEIFLRVKDDLSFVRLNYFVSARRFG